ncbi:hypothetical protein QTP88_021495 [Uroleucon formosanum]
MNTKEHFDTPTSCGLKGGDSDYGAPPPECDGFSPGTELSGPSTDDPPFGGNAGFTSVKVTVLPSARRKKSWWRMGRSRPGSIRKRRTPDIDKLVSNCDIETEGISISPAYFEVSEMQGTIALIAITGGSDGGRLATIETLIKVVQINAVRSKIVMHEIERLLVSRKIDICMVHKPAIDGKGVYLLDGHLYRVIASGCQLKATFIVANQDINILSLKQLSTPHNSVAAIAMGDTRLTVISSYFQFFDPTRTSVDALESILESLNGGVLICADDLKVHNVAGFPSTFKNRGSACLDVTLTRSNVRVTDWSVSHDPTSSDHVLISFGIVAKNDASVGVQDTITRYNWRRTDWVQFRKTLNDGSTDLGMRKAHEGMRETKAQTSPVVERYVGLRIELSRNASTAIAKRAIHKVLSNQKVAHKWHCFKARRIAWRKFVTDAGNKDPWGPVFKWLKKGGTRPSKDILVALRKSDRTYTNSLRETGERRGYYGRTGTSNREKHRPRARRPSNNRRTKRYTKETDWESSPIIGTKIRRVGVETAIHAENRTAHKGSIRGSPYVPGFDASGKEGVYRGSRRETHWRPTLRKPERNNAPTSFVTHARVKGAFTQSDRAGRSRARDRCGWPRGGCGSNILVEGEEFARSQKPARAGARIETQRSASSMRAAGRTLPGDRAPCVPVRGDELVSQRREEVPPVD